MRRDLFFGPLQDRISRCLILLTILLSAGVWGQTVFSENMGTPTGTTTIAANTFQNSSTLTYSLGEQTNPADVRSTTTSTAYSGASGGGNVWFTTTSGAYGFSIESINASTFTSLNLQFGYYKNSASAHATFSVDYYNGTSWVTLANTSATLFNESATASAGWYLSKSISLPAASQISGLKIRFVKTGSNGIRIDDVKLTGTALPAGKTVTFNSNYGTPTTTTQTAATATNLTANSFTRTGYNFANWHTTTSGTGGTSYSDGQSYSFSADLTLYAQWNINQYTVSYDLNGGTGTVPTAQTANYNSNITLSSGTGFTRAGFTFNGWNTAANGSGTAYAAGANYQISATNQTLYAQWISTAPMMSTSGTITAMTTVYGTPSTARNFTFTASNLTGTQVTATAPTGFEVATSSGGSYGSTASYAVTTGSASGTVYVRLAQTTSVGSYTGNVTLADNTNSATASATIPSSTVTAKGLTITGLTAQNKIYDANTSVTVSGTASYSGLENSESFAVSGSVSYAFSTANVGATVNRAGTYNAPSANYTVTQPSLTASITAKTLTINPPSIASRVYSPGVTTTGTVTPSALIGLIGTDTSSVAISSSSYADDTAGIGKTATINYTLGNSNYTIVNPNSGTGDITKAPPVISPTSMSVSVNNTQNITSTSPGSLIFVSANSAIASVNTTGVVTGVAVGSTNITVTQSESANYFGGSATIPVTVNAIAYANNDWRSLTSGTWTATSGAGTATWERYSSSTSTWSPVSGASPTGTTNVYIAHNISIPTAGGSYGSASIYIQSGATLTWGSSSPWTAKNMHVYAGGILQINTSFYMASGGSFEVDDNATVNINYKYTAATASARLWAGDEIFHPNSNFVIKDWNNVNADYFLPSSTDVDVYTTGGYSACFGNIIIDMGASTSTANFTLFPTGFNKNLTHNDFIFRTSGSGGYNVRFSDGTFTNITIGRNLIVENTFANPVTLQTAAGTSVLNIKGNFQHAGSGSFRLCASTTAAAIITMNVSGDILINGVGSNLTFNSSTPSTVAIPTINLKGNLTVASSSILQNLNISNSGIFNFSGIGDGLTDATTQTINVANATTASNIAFNVNSGTYLKLINQNLALGTNSKFNVLSGATLDYGFNGLTALNITGNSGGQTFSAASGSTLKITSPDGITKTASLGNVQVPINSRTFDVGASYHYIGKQNQSTGNGLADGLTNKLIVDLETDITNENLNFSADGSIKFNSTGVLEIRRGKVFDIPNNGFRNNVVENEDGESDAQKGNITMTGGRYIVSGSGIKPSLSGLYTLSAGTIEFTGTAATKIRTSTPAKQYYNVDISGTSVEAGGKNFIVNNLLKITSNTALLTIPDVADDVNPYVVTAKKGIQVIAGGQALFKNNANLLQDKDAVNNGNITMERKANVPSTQYNYWSSPVKNQVLYSLYQGIPNNTVMVYNSANDKFTILTTASAPVSQFAKGYSIKGSSTLGASITANFVGEPNNETTSGVNGIALSTAGNNYNLVGNPYPSNLNLVALYTANSSKIYNGGDETPTAYLWDNTSNTNLSQLGSGYINQNYAMVNLSSGMGLPAPRVAGAGKIPNGIVRPGQGFIIRAAETGGSLVFDNATMRTSNIVMGGTNSQYYKGTSESDDKFYLKLTTANDMHLMIAVAYYPEAQNSFERFDSAIFSESVTENFYSLSTDSKKLAIQGRKGDFNAEDAIPLGIKTAAVGNQKIGIESKDGIFSQTQNIYLKDKLLNKTINLSSGDYTFTAVKGTDATRFEIVYKDDLVLGTDAATKSDFIVYKDGTDYVIKSSKSLGRVEIYDAAGRMVVSKKTSENNIRLDAAALINGVYIIKAENSGDVRTKKVIK